MAPIRPAYVLLLILGATSFKIPSPRVRILPRFAGPGWSPGAPVEPVIPEVSEVDTSVEVDLKAMINDLKGKADLVDVREKEDFEKAHFAIATHYPLSTLGKGFFPDDPNTGVPYELKNKLYLHCSTGMVAAQAAHVLRNHFGYTDVVPLIGTGFEKLAASEIFEELAPVGTKAVTSGPGYEFYDNTIG
mmetsp:Transcript_60883/g.83605  ORF Transcript_60883/g.83605 Transcript_60883/m.83605 type:complete len:189 (-) Transcript_60883:193-759(-)|eukprot:CAMPEP_0185775890 /NCGR_PEP_ID=MMETSP1174-20130828/83698_1 /TAXON_ID=35687 /ORGANISM="Dictyocha speculum, Strain CCMP1381" /LENGTH=188 /DNA_ID=CAMNT_0028463623 /DNA_START=54 /DNA_END=620 /DNA_ORIENTATION=-